MSELSQVTQVMNKNYRIYGLKIKTLIKELAFMKYNIRVSPQFQTWFTDMTAFNFVLEYRKSSKHVER